MAQEITPSVIGDWRGLGASKGVALTTVSQVQAFSEGTRVITLTGRNFGEAAVVARVLMCPWLAVIKTSDALADEANITVYTTEAQDNDTATSVVLSDFDTAANLDFLYVGSAVPFRGCDVDVDSANATSSVITVKYWNGTAWADISDSDGTANGGATFAVDGQITWTVPSAWVSDSLLNIGDTELTAGVFTEDLYWTRWQVSVKLDSPTTLDHIIALNQSTAYAELVEGQTLEQAVHRGIGGQSAVEVVTDAGTANLIINAGARNKFQV